MLPLNFFLFANCKLKRGELIIEEKPLFKVKFNQTNNQVTKIVSKLSSEARKIFDELTDCHSAKSPTPHGIIQTNALPLGKDGSHGAIFPLISRINHSCLPNVHHNWNPRKEMETIYALKDIEPGEEILTSYIDLYNDRESRQKLLKNSFSTLKRAHRVLLNASAIIYEKTIISHVFMMFIYLSYSYG